MTMKAAERFVPSAASLKGIKFGFDKETKTQLADLLIARPGKEFKDIVQYDRKKSDAYDISKQEIQLIMPVKYMVEESNSNAPVQKKPKKE